MPCNITVFDAAEFAVVKAPFANIAALLEAR